MPVYYLPLTVFGPVDHRNPQNEGGNVLPSAYPGLLPLQPHDVGKLGRHVLRNVIEANDLAISWLRGSMFRGPGNLLPSTCERSYQGVRESYIFSMGSELIDRLGVALQELIQR
jgi:hypothetical protein